MVLGGDFYKESCDVVHNLCSQSVLKSNRRVILLHDGTHPTNKIFLIHEIEAGGEVLEQAVSKQG